MEKSGGEDSRKEDVLLRFLFIAFEIVFVVVYGCSRNDRINSVCCAPRSHLFYWFCKWDCHNQHMFYVETNIQYNSFS